MPMSIRRTAGDEDGCGARIAAVLACPEPRSVREIDGESRRTVERRSEPRCPTFRSARRISKT